MTVGITGFGAYLPWLRLSRKAVAEANAWLAPELRGRAKGHRSMGNWDEDSITMAVEAARDAFGTRGRDDVAQVLFASGTLPFSERLNAGIVGEALNLPDEHAAGDVTGALSAGLSAVSQGLAIAERRGGTVLVTAADTRRARAASTQELDFGDGAAALLLGSDQVIAEVLGEAAITSDFVDHFRLNGREIDYHWEERWIRDEGVSKLVPKAVKLALKNAGVDAAKVDRFIFPSTLAKIDAQLAKQCGIRPEAVVDNLADKVGDTGVAHGLLMLARTLEQAAPGETIVLAQFGSGAQALVLRTTELIREFVPKRGVAAWLTRSTEETHYTRFLAYKGQLQVEKGMRGEQDKKTALTTLYRHRRAILGLVAGRDPNTGEVCFPPSRLTYTPGRPALDTQVPHPLADRRGRVLSWSAESLSFYYAPPHHFGQIDFEGGGRILMEFTDVRRGDVETGTFVEMMFRVKDVDDLRGFKRYFWKATPVREKSAAAAASE